MNGSRNKSKTKIYFGLFKVEINFSLQSKIKPQIKFKKYWTRLGISCILNSGHFGEVPKLAEGAPLERE